MALLKIGRRSALLLIEGVAVIAVIVASVFAFAAWRLSVGPLDIGFARDYVEAALRDPESGVYVTFGDMKLSWPDLTRHLQLHVTQAAILDSSGTVLASVDELDMTVSRGRLLIGQIAPVAVILNKPQLRIVRGMDGAIDVALQKPQVFGPPRPDALERQTAAADIIFSALRGEKDGGVLSPLSRLRRVEARGAMIVVEDQLLHSTWVLPAADVSLSHTRHQLEGSLSFILTDEDGAESEILAKLHWPEDTKMLDINLSVQNFPVHFITEKIPELRRFDVQEMTVTLSAAAQMSPALALNAASLKLASTGGELSVEEYSSARPLPIKDIEAEIHYDAQKNAIELVSSSVRLGALTAHAKANLALKDGDISGPVTLGIDPAAHAAIDPIWPDTLRYDSSYEWIVKKISDGKFSDLKAEMNFSAQKAQDTWDVSVKDLVADFAFEEMSVNYRPPMTPVVKAKGKGRFNLDQEKLTVDIESAEIDGLAVEEAQLEFINIVTPGAGKADLFVKIAGPFSSALRYVMKEPINLKPKFTPEQVKGQIAAAVNVGFPTKKGIKVEDVKVGLTGTLEGGFLPNVVRGLGLSDAKLDLAVKDDQFGAKGNGTLDGRAITLDYAEFLSSKNKPYVSKVTAKLSVDEALRQHFGVDVSDFLAGPVDATVNYTEFQEERAEANVIADLAPARVFIDVGGYEKTPGTKGTASFLVELKNDAPTVLTGLKAEAPGLTIAGGSLSFAERGGKTDLASGKAERFAVGQTTGAVSFTVTPAGRYQIALDTQAVDLRPVLDPADPEKDEPYSMPPMQVTLRAAQAIAIDDHKMSDAQFFLDINKEGAFDALELRGKVGAGGFALNFKPDAAGVRAFRMTAEDAGATLRAFGVYQNIIGGRLLIEGSSAQGAGDRNIKGRGEIADFRVVKAPTLGKLLSALSVPGMIGLLKNDGLAFTKMDADFEWLYRQQGSFLALKDGRTSGNSVGLTFEGGFDNAEKTMDVKGTVVPLSEVNKIISSIPIVGQILTGGTGSLIAATYSIKGPQKEPQVFVNPLSVLTPGLLRRILFEGD